MGTQRIQILLFQYYSSGSPPKSVLRMNTGGSWHPELYLSKPFFFPFAVGNYTQAIECAKTYLLFFPNDEVMNQNLAYYTAMLGEEQARSIGPREVRDVPAEPDQRAEWGGGGELALLVHGGDRGPGRLGVH